MLGEDRVPLLLAEIDDRVAAVRVTSEQLDVRLYDGRLISTPLSWFPLLVRATPAQRNNWEQTTDGHGILWPDLKEELEVADLLRASAN